MKKLLLSLFLTGCSTLEYSITIPVTQNKINTGNITLQNEQVTITYKQQNILQFKQRK